MTPLSRSKGQRSRSPGRFTQRGLNAWGRCSGDRENVLGVGNYCYVASARRRARRWGAYGGEKRGGGISCRHAHSLFLCGPLYIWRPHYEMRYPSVCSIHLSVRSVSAHKFRTETGRNFKFYRNILLARAIDTQFRVERSKVKVTQSHQIFELARHRLRCWQWVLIVWLSNFPNATAELMLGFFRLKTHFSRNLFHHLLAPTGLPSRTVLNRTHSAQRFSILVIFLPCFYLFWVVR